MKRYLIIVAAGILEITVAIIAVIVWYEGASGLLAFAEQQLRLGWSNVDIERLSCVFAAGLVLAIVVGLFIYADEQQKEKGGEGVK